jgi:TRAP-type C4-dicarboxylate transport system permease large subunit
MTASGITRTLLTFSNNLVGHIRGGLGHVNVLTSMLFAGISGSALADAAGPGAIEMRMMHRAGYDEYYSAALSAATATIGPIIPPSIIMVIAISDNSVTGLPSGSGQGSCSYRSLSPIMLSPSAACLFAPRSSPGGRPQHGAGGAALLMPAIIIGGILSGVFTATEASAVAVFYALFVGFFVTKHLTLRTLPKVVVQSALVTSAALLIVSMASLFAAITLAQFPQA